MTAFNKNNLPANVDTLEKLVVWSGAALQNINKTVVEVEGTGGAVKVAQFGIFNIDSNNTSRVICRQSLLLNEDYAIDGKPIWENVEELSTTAIPSQFLPA